VASFGRDELRNEREKEKRGLRIQGLGENALAKSAAFSSRDFSWELDIAGADHFDAEKDEVGGAGVFDRLKGNGWSGEDRWNTERGGEDVEKSAEKSTERRSETFAAPTGERSRENVEDSRAGSSGENGRGNEEQNETMPIEHIGIVQALEFLFI